MSSLSGRTGRVASWVLLAITGPSCAVRVGKGPPPPDTNESVGEVNGPSACARIEVERKLAFGGGTTAFAFTWDTNHYVVVYRDPSTGDGDIYVAKIAADGTALGAAVVVESTPASSDLPTLLKTPSGYLVAWQEGSAGMAVYAHPLGPDATPVGSGATIATTQSSEQARPVLSRAPGGQVAICWMDAFEGKGGVQIAMVDPSSLQVTGPQRVAQNDIDGWPWIAGDDTTLGMVWSDKTGGPYDVRFASIDPQSLSPSDAVSLRGLAARDALLPRLMRTSFGFLSAWEDMRGNDNEIFMALTDTSGNKLGGGLVEETNTGDANWPNMAWDGSAAGVVYYQWRANRPQIFISFFDDTGKRARGLHDLQVSGGTTGWSKYPDIAWTGSEFGVMYIDTRDGAPALRFQRIACK